MFREKYEEKIKETMLDISRTRINSVRIKDISRTGLRVFKDGNIGVAGTIGSYSESDLEEKAIKALGHGIKFQPRTVETLTREEDHRDKLSLSKEVFIAQFESLLQKMEDNLKDFSFSRCVKLIETQRNFEHSTGSRLSYQDRYVDITMCFKRKSSSNIYDGGVGYTNRLFNPEGFYKMTEVFCQTFLQEMDLEKEGKQPVIFIENSELVLKQLISDLEGNRYGSGASLFSKKIGEKLFSDSFSLFQTTHPDDTFDPFFDAEGAFNEGYRYLLIEDGILKAAYTDRKTARKYEIPYTKSAVATYDAVPRVGFLNYKIKPSQKTINDLLGGQKGIFVVIASGGDYTPQGKFGSPVQLAYYYDGKNFLGKLPPLQLSGDIYEIFGTDFRGVSCDKIFPILAKGSLVTEMDVRKMS